MNSIKQPDIPVTGSPKKGTNDCFLFDLDGTLVDTQTPFHATAECMVIRSFGIQIRPEEISERFAGIPTRRVFEELVPNCDSDALEKEKWRLMLHIGKTEKIRFLPGMEELVHRLHALDIPMAVASASPESWIDLCLSQDYADDHQITPASFFLNARVSAETCTNPKPDPEVFRKARTLALSMRGISDDDLTTYVIGDGRTDVLAGLAMDANILYFSENAEFDGYSNVLRFTSSKNLSDFIIDTLL